MLGLDKSNFEKFSEQSISICICAYNEEEIITDTLHDCIEILKTIPGEHEIIVVNDGSTDNTAQLLENLSKKNSIVRVFHHSKNLGIALAQRWLIKEAKGELIFHFPADGEFKCKELYNLLAKLDEGYDIVIGVRNEKKYGFYRNSVSRIYNMLVLLLFKTNLVDIGSIRLARAKIWKDLPAKSRSAFFIAERLLIANQRGARIGFTDVDHVWRSKGKSKFNDPIKALRAFMEMLQFRLNRRDLKNLKINGESTDR